jgi:hypothetical protein
MITELLTRPAVAMREIGVRIRNIATFGLKDSPGCFFASRASSKQSQD